LLSAALIHCCSATTTTAPVMIPFTGRPATTIGTYSNTFTNVGVANIHGIKAGTAYTTSTTPASLAQRFSATFWMSPSPPRLRWWGS
jgi:hypothetical protein